MHVKRVRPEVPDRVLRVHWLPHRLLQIRALPCVIHHEHRRRPGNNESITILLARLEAVYSLIWEQGNILLPPANEV